VNEANTDSLVGENELKWRSSAGIRVSRELVRHLAAALPRELAHGFGRFRGRYDGAVPVVRRVGPLPDHVSSRLKTGPPLVAR
jgi:hypothetical protein